MKTLFFLSFFVLVFSRVYDLNGDSWIAHNPSNATLRVKAKVPGLNFKIKIEFKVTFKLTF
jgi:hypothetical protein